MPLKTCNLFCPNPKTFIKSTKKEEWKGRTWCSEMADDIIILNASGIPYFAKCFGGKTCTQVKDHTLLTGFIAAMASLTKEIGYEKLWRVIFTNRVKMAFRVDDSKKIIAVITATANERDKKLEGQLSKILNLFLEKYPEVVDESVVDLRKFNEFEKELIKEKIVKKESQKDLVFSS